MTSISVSPSGTNLLMTSRDNTISMWKLTDCNENNMFIMDKLYTLSGHTRCATTCCYATDKIFCTGGEDSKIICWTYQRKGIPKRSASAENNTHGSITSIAYLAK
ncbi:hypothetical protein, partial [Salmonella sp. s51228]|uniref:hypothetical protein n=1 Tax=Salmonella sp. s51228 TaxID=3159652 RepID=UPI00397FDF42